MIPRAKELEGKTDGKQSNEDNRCKKQQEAWPIMQKQRH